MILKKFAVAKGDGRKQLFDLDNLFCLLFILVVLTYALVHGRIVFAYFSMGLIVARIGEIIFEIKHNLFERPLLIYLLLVGIPIQILVDIFL